MLINVLDYATPALAIAAAIDGDRVYFPNIAPYTAPPVETGITVPDTSSDPDPQPTDVSLYNTGGLTAGDTVQLNTAASPTLSV